MVNGALGYGFSSITVPLALLFLANRALNPALVLVEVALNAYVLSVNRRALPAVGRRMLPIVIGLVPGIVVGTAIVSDVNPGWLRLGTFAALLPLIFAQTVGAGMARTPARRAESVGAAAAGTGAKGTGSRGLIGMIGSSGRAAGVAFGSSIGALYAVTTISGPPLALVLRNQNLAPEEFRAALGFVRLAESSLTAVSYLAAGLVTRGSVTFLAPIVPAVAVGVPIGAWVIRRVPAETFRRLCMSFDAWVVAFGLSTLLRELHVVEGLWAYSILGAVAVVDGWLLYRFRR